MAEAAEQNQVRPEEAEAQTETDPLAWAPIQFKKMLATTEDLKKGEGWVIVQDGIIRLRLEGSHTISVRGMSLPTTEKSHRTDPSTPWDRISSCADIKSGKKELYVMTRGSVVCIQLGRDGQAGKASSGGGVLGQQRQSERYPSITEYKFDQQG